jgi:diaminohydroxyphosphoribosylaminopyrimidine deaminase/5-amino-6-(5-phosphoribosylamino)uracil reductase
LIEAGVKTVYLACLDPNPLVSGQGVQALRAAGLEVQTGLLETEARQLNEIFFHFIQQRRPFVIAKWALSLDGRTRTQPEDERQISCVESQQHTHLLRRQVDAILVGAQTAIQDNPQLTARTSPPLSGSERQPLRIVLSSQGGLPLNLRIFDGSLPGKTLVVTTEAADPVWCRSLEDRGVGLWRSPRNEEGRIALPALLAYLGQREITSVLVEGGAEVHASFFKANLVNKVQVYLAPAYIGSLAQKQFFDRVQFNSLGRDFSFSVNL